MDGIDLSALSSGVVESALHVDPNAENNVEKVESSEEPQVTQPEDKVEIPEITEEEKEETIENIEKIIDESEEEEEITSDETEEKKDETQDGTNVYGALATFMKEKGLLSSEETIEDEESFVGAINKTIEESKYANLNEDQLKYLKSLEAGVPEETVKATIEDLNVLRSIDDDSLAEDKNTAIAIVTSDLKAQGWTDDRIARQIDLLESAGKLAEEAAVAKASRIEAKEAGLANARKEAEKAKAEAAKREKEQLEKLKTAIYEETKALNSIKVDDRLRNQVFEAMTKTVKVDENGTPYNALMVEREKDPTTFEKNLYYAFVLTDGFKKLDKLQRKAESAAARKLKDVVQNINIGTQVGGGTVHGSDTNVPDIVKV